MFTDGHPSLLIVCLPNGHWHIGAIPQTSLKDLLHNGIRHIGAIPPSLLNVLIQPSHWHRWVKSFIVCCPFIFSLFSRWWSIPLTTQPFLKILPSPPSINIVICRPLLYLSLCTCTFSSGLVVTRPHFSSWLAAHEFIFSRISTTPLPWGVNCSIFSDPLPCNAPTWCLSFPYRRLAYPLSWRQLPLLRLLPTGDGTWMSVAQCLQM